MRIPKLRRPRYADVASTLALLLAVSGTAYAAGTIGTRDIKDGAVTTPKLHASAVTRAKLASGAVASANVVDQSLTLADLVGIDVHGPISFSLPGGSCGTLNFDVIGATAGQSALLTWTDTVPAKVVLGPLKVVSSSLIVVRACNLGSQTVTLSNVGARIITFG